ncbi:MAG: ATP-binding protein [Ruminococcaceae bacterium]|nr:ATP-binding protein [Oscillospiraceae bacterium]
MKAVCACLKTPIGTCATHLKWKKNSLILSSENSAQAVTKNEEGRLISDKTGHLGYGLASMEYIIGMHKGFCDYRIENGCFVFEAVLPLAQTLKEVTAN